MDNFITFDMLATWVSFVSITLGVTQFLKEIKILKKIPTKYLSFMIALILIVITNLALGTFRFIDVTLYVISAIFAGMNANGVYDFGIKKDTTK